jgi:hypothetical protein
MPRDTLLRRAALGGGAVLGGGLMVVELPASGRSAPSEAQDVKILNFALLVEDLQAAFYREALDRGALRGELRKFAKVVGGHERAHAAFIRKALGPKAKQTRTFDFGNATRDERAFGRAAVQLEDLGLAAYNGQAPNLTKGTLAAAAKIVSVEARHASWIRDIVGLNPAPRAADAPATAAQVTDALNRTGFVR